MRNIFLLNSEVLSIKRKMHQVISCQKKDAQVVTSRVELNLYSLVFLDGDKIYDYIFS